MLLFFGLVAEKHLELTQVGRVIDIFVKPKAEEWAVMNMQGQMLVGLLCDKFGEEATDRFFEAIDYSISNDLRRPYLFLFDALYWLDEAKHSRTLDRWLSNPEIQWFEPLIIHYEDAGFTSQLPRLQQLLKSYDEQSNWTSEPHLLVEIKRSIKLLENPGSHSDRQEKAFCEDRDDWKAWLRNVECPPDVNIRAALRYYGNDPSLKIGRKDPCPCGSGKKYKKCCLQV